MDLHCLSFPHLNGTGRAIFIPIHVLPVVKNMPMLVLWNTSMNTTDIRFCWLTSLHVKLLICVASCRNAANAVTRGKRSLVSFIHTTHALTLSFRFG